MEVNEDVDLYTTNFISFLKLHRLNSANLPISTLQFPIYIKMGTVREKIFRLIESLRSYANFYMSVPSPQHMKEASFKLTENITTVIKLRELIDKANNNAIRNRNIFYDSGGLQILITLIKAMVTCCLLENVQENIIKKVLDQLNDVLKLLISLYSDPIRVPKDLSNDDDLIYLLFMMFRFRKIFDLLVTILENLLINRKKIFPLNKIKNFYK